MREECGCKKEKKNNRHTHNITKHFLYEIPFHQKTTIGLNIVLPGAYPAPH